MSQSLPNKQLWHALETGDSELLAHSLESGADPNLRDAKGATPLHHTLAKGSELMAARLLAYGADIHASTHDGFRPIHVAAMSSSGLVASMLLNGADANAKNDEGNTPLHYASMVGSEDVVMMLLHSDADPRATNNCGATCLHTAAGFGHASIVEGLLELVSIDVCDGNGFTPLHVAAEAGHLPAVRVLLKGGADPGVEDFAYGFTPFELSSRKGHTEVAAELKAAMSSSASEPIPGPASASRKLMAHQDFVRRYYAGELDVQVPAEMADEVLTKYRIDLSQFERLTFVVRRAAGALAWVLCLLSFISGRLLVGTVLLFVGLWLVARTDGRAGKLVLQAVIRDEKLYNLLREQHGLWISEKERVK